MQVIDIRICKRKGTSMKKPTRLAAAIIVLAGGWLGATAYTKHSVDQAYRAEIERLEKRLPILKVSDLKQEGGLFSGTTSGILHFGCAPVGGKPHPKSLAVAFEERVQYGPLPGFTTFGAARVDTRFSLTEGAPAEIKALLAKLPPLQIHTDYSYGGSARSSMVLPAGSIDFASGPAKMSMQWAEARLLASGTRDAAQLQYDWSLPELSLNAGGPEGGGAMKMSIKNMVAKGESTGRPDSWLREGKEESSIDRMEIVASAPGQPPVTLVYDHMAGHASSQIKQDFLDVGFGYSMAGLEVQGPGPAVKLANLVMDGKVQHLDAASLERIVTAMFAGVDMGCALSDDKAVEPKDPRVLLQSMLKGVDEAGKMLLAHDPAFSIDKLAFDYNGKRGEMSMSAKLQGLDASAMTGPQAAQLLMQAGQFEAHARVPLDWLAPMAGGDAQRLQQMADGFVAQGFAQRDGEYLKAEFTFAKGVGKLNGAVFPPQQAEAPPQ